MYMVLVFGLLFYVKNDWCDLLFKNFTVGAVFKIVTHFQNCYFQICDGQEIFGLNVNHLGKLGVSSKGLYQGETFKNIFFKIINIVFYINAYEQKYNYGYKYNPKLSIILVL